MTTLSRAIFTLLKDYPFFGYLLMRMRKTADKRIPTAGVRVTASGIEMIYNPDFIENIKTSEHLSFILMHECLHLMHDHISRLNMKFEKPTTEEKNNNMLANMAADAAVNTLLDERITKLEYKSPDPITGKLEMDIVSPKSLKKLLKLDFMPLSKKTSEYYFNLLKQHEDKIPKDYQYSFDEHNLDDKDGEGIPTELKNKIVSDAIGKALKETTSRGNVSQDIMEMAQSIVDATSKVNWRTLLKNYIESSDEYETYASRSKINRRYSIQAPGYKKEYKRVISVVVDTSGSVRESQLNQALAEVRRIADLEDEITLIQCDCEVKSVEPLKAINEINIVGRGGTAYQPGLDKAKELKADIIVYIGDGECESNLVDPKIPVVWVLYSGCSIDAGFGRSVVLEDES